MKVFFKIIARGVLGLILILVLFLNGTVSASSFEKNAKILRMPNIKNSQDLEQLLQNNLLDIEQQNKAEIINLEYDKNSKTIRLDIKIDSLEKIVPVEGIAKAIRDNKQIIYIDGYSDNYNLIHASINKGWSGFIPFEGGYQLTSHLNLYLEDISNNSFLIIEIPVNNEFDVLFNDIETMDEPNIENIWWFVKYSKPNIFVLESYEKDSIIDAATGTIVGIDYRWMNREVRETAHIRMVGNFRADGDISAFITFQESRLIDKFTGEELDYPPLLELRNVRLGYSLSQSKIYQVTPSYDLFNEGRGIIINIGAGYKVFNWIV